MCFTDFILIICFCASVCFSTSSLLQLQWKQDLEMGLELISKAIEIDNKCDFAYETMGTIEVQRFVKDLLPRAL